MYKKKENVLIFGAGASGNNFLEKQDKYNVLAAVDNNLKIQGTKLKNIKIIHPREIKNYNYEKIIITSGHVKSIKRQLEIDLKIPLSQVVIPLKSELSKISRPFEDKQTYIFASNLLKELVETLNKYNFKYFLDFGTLLGIVRDGKIIEWDSDIDISIYSNELDKLKKIIEKNLEELTNKFKVTWRFEEIINEENNLESLILSFRDKKKNLNEFPISFSAIMFNKTHAYQVMNKVPKVHFAKHETIDYQGEKVRVPYDYKKYLALTYGDWRTPIKNMTFENYNTSK